MGLSSEEFWGLTIEEYDARRDCWELQEKRWDLRFGVVASGYVNTKLKEGYPPIQPGAWFGYETQEEEMSAEQMLRQMKAFAAMHNAQLGLPS